MGRFGVFFETGSVKVNYAENGMSYIFYCLELIRQLETNFTFVDHIRNFVIWGATCENASPIPLCPSVC